VITLRSLIFVGCLWSTSTLAAVFMDGNDLLSECDSESPMQKSICLGYMQRTADMLSASKELCMAENVTARQVMDITIKWLRDHPESRHYTASTEIYRALVPSFPCKNSN
jgi:hypothetical protein